MFRPPLLLLRHLPLGKIRGLPTGNRTQTAHGRRGSHACVAGMALVGGAAWKAQLLAWKMEGTTSRATGLLPLVLVLLPPLLLLLFLLQPQHLERVRLVRQPLGAEPA